MTQRLHVSIPRALAAHVLAFAKAERRSVSNAIALLLTEALTARGVAL